MRLRDVVWTGMVVAGCLPGRASAQTIGTFRWQTQPYCNVLTLDVTQTGSGFRVEGTDDQCGAGADKASAIGTAFQNPDGTIGFGLSLVLAPGGTAVHIDAAITPGAFNGVWHDSGGLRGPFVLRSGAGSGGPPRPTPTSAVPTAIELHDDGSLVARGGGSGVIPATGAGDRMMWHAGKAAFRAGTVTDAAWNDANVGVGSVAGGRNTVASGEFSTAFGAETVATGANSTALGYRSRSTGFASVAAGDVSVASATGAQALGYNVTASGFGSTALGSVTSALSEGSTSTGILTTAGGRAALAGGYQSSANGDYSVALGTRAATNTSGRGSFVFTDSGNNVVQSSTPDQFLSRFAGGYVLWSTSNTVYPTSPGVRLAPGASAWSSLSDVNSKEHFRELDGSEVLDKLAAMPVRTWNYKAQDASIRHAGPTAQDFHAAFGLGEDDRRISTIDADGIALAGVKALEARTRAILERADRLEAENRDLRTRLEQLERLLDRR